MRTFVAIIFVALIWGAVDAAYEGDRCIPSTWSNQGDCATSGCWCKEVEDCYNSGSGGRICEPRNPRVFACIGIAGTDGCRDPNSEIHTGDVDDIVE